MREQLIKDLREIERFLEREADPEHTESPVTFGILRVLYHLVKAEVLRLDREKYRASNRGG